MNKTRAKNSWCLAVLTAGALLCSTAAVQATIINFDIGPLGGLDGDGGLSQTSYATVDFNNDGNDDVWNHFGQVAGNADLGGVQDINGNELATTLRASGVSGRSTEAGLAAGWGTSQDVPQAVMDTIYFAFGATITFTLKNLPSAIYYQVEIFDALNSSQARDIQVNGLFADGTAGPSATTTGDGWNRQTNGYNGLTGLLFDNVALNGSDQIVITMASTNSTYNALRITAITPEPTSLVLAVLAVVGLVARRRRRNR